MILACSKSPCCLFQVQTKQWGCNREGITCNCGVIIRDHNDLISFSCCGNPPKLHRDNLTPISVDIPRKKCLAPGIAITQLIKGFNSKYEVCPCCLIILFCTVTLTTNKLAVEVCSRLHAVLPSGNSVLFTDCITKMVDNATAHARGYLAIWPPNTLRKYMAEMKENKIERVLAYREQVPCFLSYSGYFISEAWPI